jgi:serine/threonine protein kinase
MASVWLAHDERLDRPVAVKLVADALAGDERWLARFRREARAAAALAHPAIVSVFDYGVEEGRPYLVMEYVPGVTLAARLREGEAPSQREVEGLARELLEAIGCVHAAGIVHRDVKPANVLLDEQGHLHLTDFGIAQPEDATSLTQTGVVIGTMRYLAPEVSAGEAASVRSDLYAAGVVIRELAGPEPAPRVADLIAALTAPDPGERPPSAAAALRRLEDDQTEPTLAQPVTGTTRRMAPDPPARAAPSALRWLHANGIPPAAAYGIAVLAVLVVVLALVRGGSAPSGGSTSAPAPTPAPASAPLDAQLRTLGRVVDHAARRR